MDSFLSYKLINLKFSASSGYFSMPASGKLPESKCALYEFVIYRNVQ